MIIKTNSYIVQGGGTSGMPIEIDNETDMTAILTNPDNIGKLYLFTGTTTASYTNGVIYQCINDSQVVY